MNNTVSNKYHIYPLMLLSHNHTYKQENILKFFLAFIAYYIGTNKVQKQSYIPNMRYTFYSMWSNI